MDFSALMAEGESITTVDSVTAVPSGLTFVGPAVAAGTRAQQRISGGTDKVAYKVTIRVSTSGGNTLEGEGILQVRDI